MTDLERLGLDVTATLADVKSAYKALALTAHPDRGGSAEAFNDLCLSYGRLVERLSKAGGKRPCVDCRGKRKIKKVRGFKSIDVPCPGCSHKG